MDPLTIATIGSLGLSALSGLFNGWAQGKVSEAQLKQAAAQLKLSQEQFEFMKQQALRQNRIADNNVRKINPLLDKMITRQTQAMSTTPQYTRLAPPTVNNPYGNKAPPVQQGLPGLDYSGVAGRPAQPQQVDNMNAPLSSMSAADVARRAAMMNPSQGRY